MDSQDCGPASLKMIAKHYGGYYYLFVVEDVHILASKETHNILT